MTDYKVGDKVVITNDLSGHGFKIGAEVYLLGQETLGYESSVWLASEDPVAKPQWTGRYRGDGKPIVMNVEEKDMEPALADWEKELLQPGSTAPKPAWTELEVGDTVTLKYLPTEQVLTTKVHAGMYSDLIVLGWAFGKDYEPGFEAIELLSVEKAPKPEPVKLPTTLWSQIEVTFVGGAPAERQVRHCVLVSDTDGEDRWLILSKDGEPAVGWHETKWLEEGVNRDNHPMYEIKVLFEAEDD